MEAPITGLGIEGTAVAIQLTLPRVFGIGTDEAMEPFTFLWVATKKLKICQEEGCRMLLMQKFGHGARPGSNAQLGSVLATLVRGRPS